MNKKYREALDSSNSHRAGKVTNARSEREIISPREAQSVREDRQEINDNVKRSEILDVIVVPQEKEATF